jgi:signal transduction histidine kinase
MSRTPEDENILRIVLREMRAAPLRLRIFMVVTLVYIVAMLAWSIEKVGWESILSLRTAGAWLGALSAIIIGYSFSLYTMAQEGRACTGAFRVRLRTYRMHPMLLALPVLCFIGGLCAVVSLSIFIGRFSGVALLSVGVPTGLVLWFGLHGVRVTTRFLYDHAREQADLAATAREEATRSQLAALQAQLNPHFLFNSLNTVAALVRTDARRAEATVENLAHILRRTLDRSARTTIPLSDELDYLRAYLSIEQERFGARLAVDWQVDPAALGCPVPPMTLQPLVENSLKHGLSKKLEGGRVRIMVVRRNGTLHLQVDDDGPGFSRDARDGTGMGNLRQRIATLYGGSAALHVNGGRGASVALDIPVEPPA